MGLKKISAVVALAVATSAFVGSASSASATAADPAGKYTTVTPSRILDTRSGNGGVPAAKLQAGGTITLQVAGRGGVPATGVQAVVVNLTAINSAGAG
ncbi:hypothetical protein IEE94_00805 [Yimella sp. cx-573]|nr:hypothetical protein [Yimella sp. cx-573]